MTVLVARSQVRHQCGGAPGAQGPYTLASANSYMVVCDTESTFSLDRCSSPDTCNE